MTFSRLKIAIKREQSQACLGYAEREQFGRSQNGKLNIRGFSNPWNTSRFNYRTVCKDGNFNTDGLSSPRTRCRSASFQTPFLLLFCFHGLKSPRLFALWAPRLSDVFAHRSSLIARNSLLTTHCSIPHKSVPSAACPWASTLICVVRALLYNVTVALPSLSSIRLGFQYSVRR